MTDAAVVGRILREYRLGPASMPGPVSVRRRYGSVCGPRVGYQVEWPGGAPVLVRAYRADQPLPPHQRGAGTAPVTDWLLGRAATLQWLALREYPAPRVVPTRSGDPVGVAGPWLTWATRCVAGRALARGGDAGPLGAALGRLHALGAPGAEPWDAPGPAPAPGRGEPGHREPGHRVPGEPGRGVPGKPGPAGGTVGLASWHPVAIPAALRRLDAVTALLPVDWRPLYEQFRATLLAVRRAAPGLPMAVVHGAARPGNAAATAGGAVALTGWEDGGLGLPVLDLGHCLLECHLDPGPPAGQPRAWHIEPDPGRIAAVLDGYTRWRPVDDAEREALADGIRFGAACAGAIHFERALIEGVHAAAMDARLGCLRNRVAVSQAVADLAARHLAAR